MSAALPAVLLTATACEMTCKLTRQAIDFATDWAMKTEEGWKVVG